MEQELIIRIIELLGTFAFAISGIRHAAAKQFDWFGGYVCGVAVAIGGGTIRDVMLGTIPFWMTTPIYLICTGFLFSFCLPALVCKYPTMSGIQTLLSGNYLWWLTNLVYFATGYYLSVTEFSAKRKTIIYIAGGMSLLFLSAASNLASWRQKELVLVLKELSPLVFVFSAAVFIGVRDFCQKHSAFLERYSPQ